MYFDEIDASGRGHPHDNSCGGAGSPAGPEPLLVMGSSFQLGHHLPPEPSGASSQTSAMSIPTVFVKQEGDENYGAEEWSLDLSQFSSTHPLVEVSATASQIKPEVGEEEEGDSPAGVVGGAAAVPAQNSFNFEDGISGGESSSWLGGRGGGSLPPSNTVASSSSSGGIGFLNQPSFLQYVDDFLADAHGDASMSVPTVQESLSLLSSGNPEHNNWLLGPGNYFSDSDLIGIPATAHHPVSESYIINNNEAAAIGSHQGNNMAHSSEQLILSQNLTPHPDPEPNNQNQIGIADSEEDPLQGDIQILHSFSASVPADGCSSIVISDNPFNGVIGSSCCSDTEEVYYQLEDEDDGEPFTGTLYFSSASENSGSGSGSFAEKAAASSSTTSNLEEASGTPNSNCSQPPAKKKRKQASSFTSTSSRKKTSSSKPRRKTSGGSGGRKVKVKTPAKKADGSAANTSLTTTPRARGQPHPFRLEIGPQLRILSSALNITGVSTEEDSHSKAYASIRRFKPLDVYRTVVNSLKKNGEPTWSCESYDWGQWGNVAMLYNLQESDPGTVKYYFSHAAVPETNDAQRPLLVSAKWEQDGKPSYAPDVLSSIGSADLNVQLDLLKLAEGLKNIEYLGEGEPLLIRLRDPHSCGLLLPNGKLVVVGAKSYASFRTASRKFARIVQKSGNGNDVCLKNLCLVQFMGVAKLPFRIDLKTLSKYHDLKGVVRSAFTVFPGVAIFVRETSIYCLVHECGTIFMTNAAKVADMKTTLDMIYPCLRTFGY